MSVRMEWHGLAELKAALRQLPKALTGDAHDIVDDAVEVSASSLVQSYPIGDTGNLRKGVKKSIGHNGFAVVGTVKSTSPHAHLWEFGTQVRHTRRGWYRGRMPAHKPEGLIPIAQRTRRRMNSRLFDLVRKAGFQVNEGG